MQKDKFEAAKLINPVENENIAVEEPTTPTHQRPQLWEVDSPVGVRYGLLQEEVLCSNGSDNSLLDWTATNGRALPEVPS